MSLICVGFFAYISVRSYDELCREVNDQREREYSDWGRRYIEELKLKPTPVLESEQSIQPAPVVAAVTVELAGSQPNEVNEPPIVIKQEEEPERPPSVVFCGEKIAQSESGTQTATEV